MNYMHTSSHKGYIGLFNKRKESEISQKIDFLILCAILDHAYDRSYSKYELDQEYCCAKNDGTDLLNDSPFCVQITGFSFSLTHRQFHREKYTTHFSIKILHAKADLHLRVLYELKES